MTSLLDIAPLRRTVKVQGVDLEVGGVPALGIALLLSRFPEVRKMFSGMEVDLTPERVFEAVPEAVAVIIASATGYTGNLEAEKKAASLPVGDQMDLIAAIIELTMPAGVGPFVEKVRLLLEGASAAVTSGDGGKGQATN